MRGLLPNAPRGEPSGVACRRPLAWCQMSDSLEVPHH